MPKKGKQYKCSACKDKHSPPTGKRCSRVHGDTIIEDLSFIQQPPTQVASGLEHGLQHGHSGSGGGRLVATQGAHRPVMDQHREIPDVHTVPFEKPENLGGGHPGIDVVLQELRAISSRLSQVERSIDSQSNTRTSTPHRTRPFQTVTTQGCNKATGVVVPVSSSSVGVGFTSVLPVSTMASAGFQHTSPPQDGVRSTIWTSCSTSVIISCLSCTFFCCLYSTPYSCYIDVW